MPRKKQSIDKKFEFKGFVNLDFNSDEKIVIGDWISTFKPDLDDSIVVLCEAGYKVGISYAELHEVYHISVTCRLKTSKYHGFCFTLKHTDVTRGVGIIRYVFDTLLAEELYNVDDRMGDHSW